MTRKRQPGQDAEKPVESPSGDSHPGDDATAYAVGYKRPPKHTQFQPGRSGNPRGRPKAARNVDTELREELFASVTVVENGKRRKVPKIRALIRKLMEKSFNGDTRAAMRLIEVSLRLATPEEKADLEADLSPDDADLLDMLAQRAQDRRPGARDG